MDTFSVIANGNQILKDTPDNLWWNHNSRQVLELAFPDWDIVDLLENENYNKPTVRIPRVILSHKNTPDMYMVMLSTGVELFPGRMSTMGQFFRFKNYPEGRMNISVGNNDVIVTFIKKSYYKDYADKIVDWFSKNIKVEQS